MTQMLTTLGDLFQEDLVPGIANQLNTIDQTYARVVESSETVIYDQISKNYQAKHTFLRSLGGAIRAGSPLGPDMISGTGAANIINAHDGYPGVMDSPLPGIANYYITIAKLRGNTVMNLAMLRANKLDTVGDYPAITLQQTAFNVAHSMVVGWYINDSAQVIKLDATGTGAAVAISGNTVTYTGPTATGAIIGRKQRIKPGMQYDVWYGDATMSVCLTRNGWAMLSSNVDLFSSATIDLYFQSNTDAVAAQAYGTTGDVWLVPYSALPNRAAAGLNTSIWPCGFQSWLRATGTMFGSFGDLDVTTYGSMFKSYAVTVSAALTETKLNQYLKTFIEATGVRLDTMIITDGVLVSLLDSYGADASSTIVRLPRGEGNAADIALGWDSLKYRYDGQLIDIHTSTLQDAGAVTIMKAKDGNLCRYKPPSVPGTEASVPGFMGDIEWLGQFVGDTIWMPSTAPGGGKTDGVEAPFDYLVQHAAKEPRGIALASVTEK